MLQKKAARTTRRRAIRAASTAGVYALSNYRTARLAPQIERFERLENLRLTVQSLAAEAVVYSQKHPAIDRILTNSPLTAPPTAQPRTSGRNNRPRCFWC